MSEPRLAQPQVFVRELVDQLLAVDAQLIARTLQDRGTSPEGIANTTIIFDAKNRLSYKGSHTPKLFDRLFRGTNEDNKGRGSVIRVGTRLRGRDLTPEEINHTIDHELVHVAQTDRGDFAPIIGNLAIWGGLIGGAVTANRSISKRTKRLIPRVAFTAVGGVIGNRIAYQLAPHERQARSASANGNMAAITKK